MLDVLLAEATFFIRKMQLIRVVLLLLALAICWPLVSLGHESLVLLTAFLLNDLSRSPIIVWLVEKLALDQVYVSVFVQSIGHIQPLGVGVVRPIGEVLHQALPSVFVDPKLVENGAYASAVIEAGSPMLARFLTKILASASLILIGLALTLHIVRQTGLRELGHMSLFRGGLLLFGLILQFRAITAVFTLPMTMLHLETMGLAHFLTKVVTWTQQDYVGFVQGMEPRVPYIGPLLLLLALYALSTSIILFVYFLTSKVKGVLGCWPPSECAMNRRTRSGGEFPRYHRTGRWLYPMLTGLIFIGFLADFGGAKTNYEYEPLSSTREEISLIAQTPQAPETPLLTAAPSPIVPKPQRKSSDVTISGGDYNYEYRVNGIRQRIRGVGYNVQYQDLETGERVARYCKDFKAMREAGINTILGWDPANFDQHMLEAAQRNDIGVILPYHLPAEADYTNPEIREEIKQDVLNWVTEYKNDPALRMWGIGNEVLHGIRQKEQKKAFVEFYRELVDLVHEADPDHPIIYREAEDVFVPLLKKVFTKDGATRPWLVYGTNIFTFRLKDVLADWQNQALDVPLIVSEFAPTGLPPRDRPAGYLTMWGMMLEHSSMVIGGFMYVWTTEGPEPLDRVYGLVDGSGTPTDGSLEAMKAQFISEEQGGN